VGRLFLLATGGIPGWRSQNPYILHKPGWNQCMCTE